MKIQCCSARLLSCKRGICHPQSFQTLDADVTMRVVHQARDMSGCPAALHAASAERQVLLTSRPPGDSKLPAELLEPSQAHTQLLLGFAHGSLK